ncbi:MAG: hypothetical protein AAF352_03845, partial [Pseudomonadota bacterium]
MPPIAKCARLVITKPQLDIARGGLLNYTTGGTPATIGDTGVEIDLIPVPDADNPDYEPPSTQLCSVCHFPIVNDWSTSSHSRAGQNEWV